MLIVRFLHFMGSAMWIGGGLAAMLITINSRREPVEVRAGVFRLMTQVQTMVIGLGAIITLGTGIIWTMWLVTSGGADTEGASPGPGLLVMQTAGLLGGLLVLFVAIPTAVKLGGLAIATDDGQMLPIFESYRKRQMIASSVAGALAVISLLAGVMFP